MTTYAGDSTATVFAFDATCTYDRGCISAVCTGTGANAADVAVYVSNVEGAGVFSFCAAANSSALWGANSAGYAVIGWGEGEEVAGVFGGNNGAGGYGVIGASDSNEGLGVGVFGHGSHTGVRGESLTGGGGTGVVGVGNLFGVDGTADDSEGTGVSGYGKRNGVAGTAMESGAAGVFASDLGYSSSNAIIAVATGTSSRAAYLDGKVTVDGTLYVDDAAHMDSSLTVIGYLSKPGGGFRIDHPLDPGNQYLEHSFVESPDMKNIYDGSVTADSEGVSVVQLPAYFEAANKDFRYQLTAIGASAPELHISAEFRDGCFTIAGAKPGQKICWQVTGIRRDVWAEANRIVPEREKSGEEKGLFLHPELHGEPSSKAIGVAKKGPAPRQVTQPTRSERRTAARPTTPQAPVKRS